MSGKHTEGGCRCSSEGQKTGKDQAVSELGLMQELRHGIATRSQGEERCAFASQGSWCC